MMNKRFPGIGPRSSRSLSWGLPLLALLAVGGCKEDDETSPDSDSRSDAEWVGETLFSEIASEVHPDVQTILVVRVTLAAAVESLSIRYSFESDEWYESPARPAATGEVTVPVLGVPENTTVSFEVVAEINNETVKSDERQGVTGALPSKMPRPTVTAYEPDSTDGARWLLGSVEATPGENRYYEGPFWLYIMDRDGRIVWYYSDLGYNPCMAYPRIARDGTHVVVEKRLFFPSEYYQPRVARMTLDRAFFEEIPIDDLADCIDVTDDGGILYNTYVPEREDDAGLKERLPSGEIRHVWSCTPWAVETGAHATQHACYSNTVSWDPARNTVLLSMPYIDTVVEIDRATGELIAQYGTFLDGGYGFEPDTVTLAFNHFPNFTPDGTLLVSSHLPGYIDYAIPGEHRFYEFEVDRQREMLVEKWRIGDGLSDWPMYKGEATRAFGGNTLLNFGTGGVIREVTPEKSTVFEVKWDADFSDDRFNLMVGHAIFVDDLYALCEGWDR